MCWGIYGGHHKNTCPLGGAEIKILKANGGANEKRMCLKGRLIYLSNCLEFTRDFMLNNINVCKVSRSYSLELDMTV